jgi:hypothetical protein
MLEILQDSDGIKNSELITSIDDKPLENIVEQQLQEAVQTQTDDIGDSFKNNIEKGN